MSKMTKFEKKWGRVCVKCGLRKGTFSAGKSAEGGQPSVCKCDKI